MKTEIGENNNNNIKRDARKTQLQLVLIIFNRGNYFSAKFHFYYTLFILVIAVYVSRSISFLLI